MKEELTRSSVPPHLRKRALAAAKQKTDVRLGDLGNLILIGSTPPASIQSQMEKPTQRQVPSNEPSPQDHAPPSPPTTDEQPPQSIAWDAPIEAPSASRSRRNENPRWPRIPKPRHVWPKAREIPRNLTSGSQSDGGVSFKSDSGGDPWYDVRKLMDWHGDWQPPPEDWAARKGFTTRHFGQVIETWANGHSQDCTELVNIETPAFHGLQDEDGLLVNKDVVPRYWLHDTIDNDPPRKFWEELPHRAPAPMSDGDIKEDPPYWERWDDKLPDDCFMTPLKVSEARIDPSDNENEIESPFAMISVNDRLVRVKAIEDERKRRQHARRTRPIPNSRYQDPSMQDKQLKPKANIYLRPVQPADIPGIMIVYNHYVKNTIHASELEEQTEAQIRVWIDGIVRAGLPCILAVSKRNQRKGPQGYVTETIVGFAYLTDLADSVGMYRFTFELEVYVHPGYVHQGIGKCLLDQMMDISNTGYIRKGGYEWVNEFEYLKHGSSRTIKTVLANLHYEKGENVEWATKYLGEFGFKAVGRLSEIGHKAGKAIGKVIFQLHTTEVVDPFSIPMIQA